MEEQNGAILLLNIFEEANLHYGTCDMTYSYGNGDGSLELCYADLATMTTFVLNY